MFAGIFLAVDKSEFQDNNIVIAELDALIFKKTGNSDVKKTDRRNMLAFFFTFKRVFMLPYALIGYIPYC
jgi:hypothetical protein